MRSVIAHGLAAALLMGVTHAQVKTITGEQETRTATVEAIEQASRTVTLKGEDGKYHQLYVPRDVKRFETLKVGDTVKATYYENVTLVPHDPAAKPVDTTSGATTRAADKAAATSAVQRTITATITAIDMKTPAVTFSGPNGWTYTSRVEDKQALAKAKVGDRFDITWTQAMVVALDPVK